MNRGQRFALYYQNQAPTTEKKLELLLSLNMEALVGNLSPDLSDALDTLTRDFMNPMTEDGEPDVEETLYRFRLLYKANDRNREDLGKAIREEEKKLPEDITEPDRSALAMRLANLRSRPALIGRGIDFFIQTQILMHQALDPERKDALIGQIEEEYGGDPKLMEEMREDGMSEGEIREARFTNALVELQKHVNDGVDLSSTIGDIGAYELGKSLNPAELPKIHNKELDKQYFTKAASASYAEAQKQDAAADIEESRARVEEAIAWGDRGETREIAECCLKSLEDTGVGGGESHFYWHRKNSDAFETIKGNLRTFIEAQKEGRDPAQEKAVLVDSCLSYLKGKESVRSTAFGKIRFETVMLLLSQVMPRKQFEELTDRINAARGVSGKKNHPNHVSPEKYDTLSAKASFRVGISDSQVAAFRNLENLYGPVPMGPEAWFSEEIVTMGEVKKLSLIGEDLPGIGGEEKIRAREFAALGYFAARAAGKAEITTNLLGQNAPAKGIGAAFDDLEAARQEAAGVLHAYGSGNKEALATIIADGLTGFVRDRMAEKRPGDLWVLEGEMAARACEMLTKDPELEQIAKQKGLTEETLRMLPGIRMAADIHAQALQAEADLKKYGEQLKPETQKQNFEKILKDRLLGFMAESGDAEARKNIFLSLPGSSGAVDDRCRKVVASLKLTDYEPAAVIRSLKDPEYIRQTVLPLAKQIAGAKKVETDAPSVGIKR